MDKVRCPNCDRLMPGRIDGERFGRWVVVLDRTKRSSGKAKMWMALCRCDCGTEKHVVRAHLIDGSSGGCRSCAQKARWMEMRRAGKRGRLD